MGRACLVQHGCYSVLDTNMAAALYTRAAVLFSCHAVQRGHAGPIHVPHSVWLWRDTFLLLYSNKTNKKKAFIKMLVVLALTCLPPCSSAEEVELCDDPWTFSWLSFSACEGHFLTPSPLNWKWMDDTPCMTHCFYVHAYWTCTTVYMHFSSYIKWSGSLFVVRKG